MDKKAEDILIHAKGLNETMNLYHITNEYAVLESSITDLGISTSDRNERDYLKTDGTNRHLKHGITPEGEHLIYMNTNGGPMLIEDDLEAARRVCADMGDLPGTEAERVRTGAERILQATETLIERYVGNEDALTQLDWFAEKSREVLASLVS